MAQSLHSLITSTNSDGVSTKRPRSMSGLTAADIEYCKLLGRMRAQDENLPNPESYTIDRLPDNYVAFERIRPTGAKDRYVFGHPKGRFNSADRFYVHYRYLQIQNPKTKCGCFRCSPPPKIRPINRKEGAKSVKKVDDVDYSDDGEECGDSAKAEIKRKRESNEEGDDNEYVPASKRTRTDGVGNKTTREKDSFANVDNLNNDDMLFKFESIRKQLVKRATAVQLMGHYCTKARDVKQRGDLSSHVALMTVVDLAFWVGLGVIAWHLLPEYHRITIFDKATRYLTDLSISDDAKHDLRSMLQCLNVYDVQNKPLFDGEDDGILPASDTLLSVRDNVRDLVIREFGFEPVHPLRDLGEVRDGIVELLTSDVPMALKFEVVSLYTGNIPDMEDIFFESNDDVLIDFIRIFRQNF